MSDPRSVRLWPAVSILLIQGVGLVLTVTPSIQNSRRFLVMMAGPLLCLLLFLVWLLFLSRLAWKERLALFVGLLGVGALVGVAAHPSFRVALWIYGVPLAMLAITLGLAISRQHTTGRRLATVLGVLALSLGSLTLLRLGGFTGSYWPEPAWRWSPTVEETLANSATGELGTVGWNAEVSEWPGFRGPDLLGRARGPATPLDWSQEGPEEVWRIEVGPGWSSFAEASGRLFTQEQRGEQEVITSYDAETGELLWSHGVPARFDEVVSGAGPRATPTVSGGRVFAYGATAVLSALDAATGELLWQHDLMAEAEAQLPVWGFSGSPLVVEVADTASESAHELVVVYAGGVDDQGLMAFDAASGERVWQVASRGMNFSSAQSMVLAEQPLVLFADRSGVLALEPATGELAWRFTPESWEGPPMVQFQPLGPSDVIVALGDGMGIARIEATRTEDTWQIREVWSSRGLKPSFNDFVAHDGFLYGFDQNLFACLDATTGERLWKRGRYGFGQVVLLEESGQLLVAAENGDVVLLDATPEQHTELARIPVLDGKTWNHPIVAQGRLVVRNGAEAVSLSLERSVRATLQPSTVDPAFAPASLRHRPRQGPSTVRLAFAQR